MVTWTAIIEDVSTGVIRTPVLQAGWNGKDAMSFALDTECSGTERVVCLVRGKQDQGIYPSVDNMDCEGFYVD